jgi:hypothetical protein
MLLEAVDQGVGLDRQLFAAAMLFLDALIHLEGKNFRVASESGQFPVHVFQRIQGKHQGAGHGQALFVRVRAFGQGPGQATHRPIQAGGHGLRQIGLITGGNGLTLLNGQVCCSFGRSRRPGSWGFRLSRPVGEPFPGPHPEILVGMASQLLRQKHFLPVEASGDYESLDRISCTTRTGGHNLS